MLAIYKREVRSYFQTVIGWLFLAVILAVFGLYFYVYSLNLGYPYITYSLGAICFILLLMSPILTMKSFAEERKNKTDQLMFTSPVTIAQVVAGKYLAMLTVFSVDVLFISIMPLVLSIFGTTPVGENYLSILGFWLYGAACLAVGMFISSLTDNIVISAVLTFATLFLSYMMSTICGLISSQGNLLTQILSAFDLYSHYKEFQSGCLKWPAVVYDLSVILLFCFLTVQSVQKRRLSFRGKKLSAGAFSAATIAVGIALAVMVNLIAGAIPEEMASIDCSFGRIYELTDTTREFAENLQENITIYVMAARKKADSQISETLERYRSLSDRICVEYVDTAENPAFYKNYADTVPTAGSLIVVSDKRSRVIDYNDIYVHSYVMNTSTYSYEAKLSGYDAEGQLSSAIEYVTMEAENMPVIYAITGHGESEIGSTFQDSLAKANINYSDLELMKLDGIPEGTEGIIINAPTSDFNEQDAQKVIDYLNLGGKVLVSMDFGYTEFPNFCRILQQFGMAPDIGLVVENNSQYYYSGNSLFLLPMVEYTDYTASVYGAYIFAPYSIAWKYEGTDASDAKDLSYHTLLQTTDEAVLKENPENASSSLAEDGDKEGPFAVAEVVEDQENGAVLLLYGTSYLLGNEADEVVSMNNSRMFTNCISLMTGETELISSVIPIRSISVGTLTIPTLTAIGTAIALAGVLPLMMLLLGVAIWILRRRD